MNHMGNEFFFEGHSSDTARLSVGKGQHGMDFLAEWSFQRPF